MFGESCVVKRRDWSMKNTGIKQEQLLVVGAQAVAEEAEEERCWHTLLVGRGS